MRFYRLLTLTTTVALWLSASSTKAQNPYESLGVKVEPLTLSKGKYVEFFDKETVVQIGTVLFNTVTNQVVAFLKTDTLYSESNLSPEIISRWLSPDPLASEFPSWSPYNYVLNNPIRLIDPDGRAPDEFNVDVNTGDIKKVSDKGGSETDYYNIGETNNKGEFKSEKTVSIDRPSEGGNINAFRIKETQNSTISAFNIPGTEIKGVFLEPGGPSTIKSGQDKRIPDGSYDLSPNTGSKFPGTFKLSNDEVSKGRAILIHAGNFNENTFGCLLPGASFSADKRPQGSGELRTFGSGQKLGEINNFIKQKGAENVKLNLSTQF